MGILAIFCAAALAALFWVRFALAPASWPKSAVKTGSVALLAVAALGAGAPWVALALALGAAGDFSLSRPGRRWFLAGMAAFAAGHLAYAGLLLGLGPPRLHVAPMVALVVFGLVMGALLWRPTGALRGPVLAYVAVIVAMGLAALGLPGGAGRPDRARRCCIVHLPVRQPAGRPELFWARDPGLRRGLGLGGSGTCYWLAQLGLLLGLAGSVQLCTLTFPPRAIKV